MPEDGSTTTGSEADQTHGGTQGGTGAAGDGASGEQNSEALRNLLAQRDRQSAELDKLKAELAAATATPAAVTEPTSDEAKPLTAESVMALLRREREMGQVVPELREQFQFADPSIFVNTDRFDSVEALRAAAEADHTRVKALAETAAKPLVDAALAPYIEKYGRLAASTPESGGGQTTQLPSWQEVRTYSQGQLSALVAQHGEDVLQRIRQSAFGQS